MAEIRVENLQQGVRRLHRGEGLELHRSPTASSSVLLGPSGCGKTTTLRMIAGLELPTSGQILLGGEDVTFKRASERDIAFVFQLFALYPHMNVRQNIGFPLRCQGVPRAEIAPARRGDGAAPAHRPSARPARSRASPAATASAWRSAAPSCAGPKAFLMDEPLGTLDAEFRDLMCDELRGAARPHRRDHGLCHPRPARGDVDGRHDRRHEPAA